LEKLQTVPKFKASFQLEFAEGGKGQFPKMDPDAPTKNKRKVFSGKEYIRGRLPMVCSVL
jgi:hypothetical protein